MSTQPARGMRDFLPDELRRRQYVIRTIAKVYESYGFEPLETPSVENLDTLMGKYGDEGNQLIFKVLKRGADLQRALEAPDGQRELADLALRYDLTVPFARVVANYRGQLPKFFKRYQIQPVWRADRPARGRFREFYQCDVDVLGSTSAVVEVELCAAVSDVLDRLGFGDFTIRLNDRRLLTAMLEAAGVPPEKHSDALVALDKLEKIQAVGVLEELNERGAHSAVSLMQLFSNATPDTSNEIRLDQVRRFLADRDQADGEATLDALTKILKLSESTPAAGRLRFDPTLARGLSYYTGAIMEISVSYLAGSLGGGGRYDNLVGMFLGQQVPACGFSLGLERIIVVMTERDMFPATVKAVPADVLVAQWSAETAADALSLAGELRRAGLRVDLYPDDDKLGKQFKYAGDRALPFVAVVGDDERAAGEVSIKDLRSGAQERMPRAQSAAFIAARLAQDRTPGSTSR